MTSSALMRKYHLDIKVVCYKEHHYHNLEIGKTYTYHTMVEGENKSYEEYFILENDCWISTEYFVSLSEWREQQLSKIV